MDNLLEVTEYFYDNKLLGEMANIQPSESGMPRHIFVSRRGRAQHGPRIKVSNVPGTFSEDDSFSLTLEANPRIIGTCKLKSEHLDDLKDWIKLNHEHIKKTWDDHGIMSNEDIKAGLKRI